jgi:two-component system, chemotaxis family, protein-glutamate methylesterase/glutaminase
MSGQVRVLVVDDSAVVRGLLARALETDPQIVLAGTAMHGQAALQFLKKEPVDVVVLDVEMPVMDGMTALEHMQRDFPQVKVVMASALTYEGAETTVRAMSRGAVGCIGKPQTSSMSASIEQVSRELVPLVKALGRCADTGDSARKLATTPLHRTAVVPPARPALRSPTGRTAPPTVVVIGSSTGGPQALRVVLTGLPTDFPVPILIVQHMPPLFTPMLAKHLEKDTGRRCAEGVSGGPIEHGRSYVAPGDFHMEVTKSCDRMVTQLTQAPPEHFCRPSVNPLFRTAAEWYGGGVLAVMLTGMGEDGTQGTREVVQRGGHVIAQDEATSVVWGMPGAVVRAGLAHEVLPLNAIAPAILRLCLQEVAR